MSTRMTTQDNQQLEDARRVSVNQLAGSGLRGSGRAVTGMLRRVNEGGVGQIVQNNRTRQGNAATALANMSTGATTGMSSIDQRGGASVADITQSSGKTQAGYQQDIGTNAANAELANGSLANSTLGAISGIFAADERNRQREDRYGKQYAS